MRNEGQTNNEHSKDVIILSKIEDYLFPSDLLENHTSISASASLSIQRKFITRCLARIGRRRRIARALEGEA